MYSQHDLSYTIEKKYTLKRVNISTHTHIFARRLGQQNTQTASLLRYKTPTNDCPT